MEHCEYGVEEENQIRDHVLYFIRDKVLKRKLFREENPSLTKLQEIANIFDEPEALLLSPAGTRENANTVYANRTSGLRATERTFQGKCWKCNNLGHIAKDCRKSKHHTCEKCGKTGHFAVCCHDGQSRGGANGGQSYRKPTYESRRGRGHQNVRNIVKQDNELGEEDTFYVFLVNTSACTMAINIDDNPVNMIIDYGSSCNIIPEATFRKMPGLTLKFCNNRVYAYDSHNPLQVVGCCDVNMSVNGGGRVNTAKVLVVKGDHAALLGRKTAEHLGVLRVGLAENVYTTDVLTKEKLREMYRQMFSGLGKLKNYQLELKIDESVTPVAQPIRLIPFSRREKVEEKLRELEDMDVIEKVDGPTKWMNPLVTVENPNGDIRVCLDMREANKAIVRERQPIPTVEETVQEMGGMKVFTKLDLNMAFHQVELHPQSRDITTFAAPNGLYRYKRLVFGLNMASEKFNHIIRQVVQDCPGVYSRLTLFINARRGGEPTRMAIEQWLKRHQWIGQMSTDDTTREEECLFGELEFYIEQGRVTTW